ncbi:MAG: hypothetical protein KDK50_05950 [Chlamydiia bacterium]|nr:hypothetical protein [Chlamydiia bacterium]
MLDIIYTDRLKSGKTQEIDQELPPSFMEVEEAELKFESPIAVKGRAYLSGDHLVVDLEVHTKVKIPCAICNKMTAVPISSGKTTYTVPPEEIKSAAYKPDSLVREALLLEVPMLAECQGKCPEREILKPLLEKEEHDTCFPFSELKLEEES